MKIEASLELPLTNNIELPLTMRFPLQ